MLPLLHVLVQFMGLCNGGVGRDFAVFPNSQRISQRHKMSDLL